MQLPREPASKEAITADWGRQVVRMLRAIAPRPSPDVLPQTGAGGTSYRILDRARSSAGVAAEQWPFQVYSSSFTGTGAPPDDQVFRVRVRPGSVNTILPSDINEEVILPPGVSHFIYVNGTFDAKGALQSAALAHAEVVPLAPDGSADNAPAHLSVAIALVKTTDTGIETITPLRKASIWITPVVYNVGCGSVTMIYQVT